MNMKELTLKALRNYDKEAYDSVLRAYVDVIDAINTLYEMGWFEYKYKPRQDLKHIHALCAMLTTDGYHVELDAIMDGTMMIKINWWR
jgi:hypothetical protein